MSDQEDDGELADKVTELLAGVEAAAERLRALRDVPLVPEEPFDPTWLEAEE